ncbi:catalytic/ hydrolase [Wolffia australiana]
MAVSVAATRLPCFFSSKVFSSRSRPRSRRRMSTAKAIDASITSSFKTFDSHLHVWASPEEALKYPYHPGQEPTLPGHVDFLLQCMDEAGVDGALIVQPINHLFDHSYVTSVLKKYPSKFIGCCLANPSDSGSGVALLEQLVLKDGYRAVRFNPYIWPLGQKMTNEIGKSLFAKAGELNVPVGLMCMKGLGLHISEIEELCTNFPSTVVLIDHMGFTKPEEGKESLAFAELLSLSRFPQIYVKFSALFRLSKRPFPYSDMANLLSQAVSSFGPHRIMWGSDFPFVVPECGYKGAKEAVLEAAAQIPLTSDDVDWIMGRTATRLFDNLPRPAV